MVETGFSRVRVTPPRGIRMAGHPADKRASDVLDDLCARAMALSIGGETVVFVSVDVLFLDGESVGEIRRCLCDTGIPGERICAWATHTHSGPMTTALFGEPGEREYGETLKEGIVRSVRDALASREPARISCAESVMEGFSFNSRFIMNDGTVETHPFRGSSRIVGPEGPTDPAVVALLATDAGGSLMGGVANYACHPQVLRRADTRLSADFPGRMEKEIREAQGPDAVLLFANGACGNICPVDAMSGEARQGVGEEWMEMMGRKIARRALGGFDTGRDAGKERLAVARGTIEIPLRDVPDDTVRRARRFLEENENREFALPRLSDYGTETGAARESVVSLEEFLATPYWKKQEAKEIVALAGEGNRPPEKCEITAVGVGDTAMVMLPFELFVELGLEIRERSPFRNTMVVELANGWSGYVPTLRAFSREGGYETRTLRSSKLVPEAGGMVVDEACRLLKDIRNGG